MKAATQNLVQKFTALVFEKIELEFRDMSERQISIKIPIPM